MKRVLLTSIAAILAFSPAASQSIDISELDSAAAYEPGVLSYGNGGLSQNLWNGTSAATALDLIEALPESFSNPIARDLAEAALLSSGVPPEGRDNAAFGQARLAAIIKMANMAAAQDIAQRSPNLASSRQLKADLALLSGDAANVCALSDSVLEERSQPYWMKLRAFCHVERGETAAAELTLDLLRSSGDDDTTFQALMRPLMAVPGKPNFKNLEVTPLSMAMMDKAGLDWPAGQEPAIAAARKAFNPLSSAEQKLSALFKAGHALSDAQITEIIDGFSRPVASDDLAGGFVNQPLEPNLETAVAENTPAAFAQLYTLSQIGQGEARNRAVAEILRRANKASSFDRFVTFLEPQIRAMSYSQLSQPDIALMARAAIMLGDIPALQQIHGLLDEYPYEQNRVALATDALGNGFYAGTLGTDIDDRLMESGKTKARALRDALIAHGLGSQLSKTALKVIDDKNSIGRFSGKLFALQSASSIRAEAETALRAALILEDGSNLSDLEIYQLVASLYQAGLTDFAAKLGAQDFMADFPE